MRFSIRTLIVIGALAAIGLVVWFARFTSDRNGQPVTETPERGRSIVAELINNANHKPTWHAVLDYNGLDPERHHLRGQPKGVWPVLDSNNSIVWVMTKHNALIAISGDGAIHDLGGIVCNGNPTSLWTGTTTGDRAGIVLVSQDSSPDAANYVMFVDFDERSRLRSLVQINTDDFDATVSEVNDWPLVGLTDRHHARTGHFSFPDCEPSLITASSDGPKFWDVRHFD